MVTSLRTPVLRFPAGMDAAANLARLTAGIDRLHEGALAVAPEGAPNRGRRRGRGGTRLG